VLPAPIYQTNLLPSRDAMLKWYLRGVRTWYPLMRRVQLGLLPERYDLLSAECGRIEWKPVLPKWLSMHTV
jgi:hypothetical protein